MVPIALFAIGPVGVPAVDEKPSDRMDCLVAWQSSFAELRDQLWEVNDEFWHRGEHNLCIATLIYITEIDRHDCEAYSSGAWLLQNDFRDDEAEALLRKGLAWNRDRYDLYFDLGFFLYMHERFDEASAILEAAVTFEPPFLVHHVLAFSDELAGRQTDALDMWLQLEALEVGSNVPALQIERIMTGGPPTNVPATYQRWHRERRAAEGRG